MIHQIGAKVWSPNPQHREAVNDGVVCLQSCLNWSVECFCCNEHFTNRLVCEIYLMFVAFCTNEYIELHIMLPMSR